MTLRLVIHDSALECALTLPPTTTPVSPLYGGAARVLDRQTWDALSLAAEHGWLIGVSGHDFRAVTCSSTETHDGYFRGILTMDHAERWQGMVDMDRPNLAGEITLTYTRPPEPPAP